MPKKFKNVSLKIHKGAGTLKKTKTFQNKDTEPTKNYMESLNSKNKNIKGGTKKFSPLDKFHVSIHEEET